MEKRSNSSGQVAALAGRLGNRSAMDASSSSFKDSTANEIQRCKMVLRPVSATLQSRITRVSTASSRSVTSPMAGVQRRVRSATASPSPVTSVLSTRARRPSNSEETAPDCTTKRAASSKLKMPTQTISSMARLAKSRQISGSTSSLPQLPRSSTVKVHTPAKASHQVPMNNSRLSTSRSSTTLDSRGISYRSPPTSSAAQMDAMAAAAAGRNSREKSYKNVFKGSVLVGTLIDHDTSRFASRAHAVAFAQKLLDMGHIESIVGSSSFEDSVHLYRWCDETLVREAKKMVSTTSSHIPKKRLIELIDRQPEEGREDGGGYGQKVSARVRAAQGSRSSARSSGGRTRTAADGSSALSESRKSRRRTGSDDGLTTSSPRPRLPVRLSDENLLRACSNDSLLGDSRPVASEYEDSDVIVTSEREDPTVMYDGVEMPALDLENYTTITTPRSQNTTDVMVEEHVEAISQMAAQRSTQRALDRSFENLTDQANSYSDNEKQLLEQMKRMRNEHEHVVSVYKDKINELMGAVSDLKTKVETKHRDKSLPTSPVPGNDNQDYDEPRSPIAISPPTVGGGPVGASGIPPPPPPPGSLLIPAQKVVKPTKPAVKPRVKMRSLFWNRIILEPAGDDAVEASNATFWHSRQEPNFDVDEFEKLFGKNPEKDNKRIQSLHDAIANSRNRRHRSAKILDDNRSRAVAIKLRSMHCDMADISRALYRMDFTKLDLESLYRLYEIRGTEEELDKINLHLQAYEDVPLDQPEAFLRKLSQMSHFPERIECLILRKRFQETVFNIDEQLSTVQRACEELKNSEPLKKMMELVLAFGNYMNGGTQRGQADGFEINFLIKDYEENAGKNDAMFYLPEPQLLHQASQVNFIDLDANLNRLQHQLKTHSKKAQLVCLDTEEELLQPFKYEMDEFFESAESMVSRQVAKLEATQKIFKSLLKFLAVKDATEQVTCETFFSLWWRFLEDCRHSWREEQKRVARVQFERVEAKRKDRLKTTRRRQSVVEDEKSLKQKFRRRSEAIAATMLKPFRQEAEMTSDTEATVPTDSEEERTSTSSPIRRGSRENLLMDTATAADGDVIRSYRSPAARARRDVATGSNLSERLRKKRGGGCREDFEAPPGERKSSPASDLDSFTDIQSDSGNELRRRIYALDSVESDVTADFVRSGLRNRHLETEEESDTDGGSYVTVDRNMNYKSDLNAHAETQQRTWSPLSGHMTSVAFRNKVAKFDADAAALETVRLDDDDGQYSDALRKVSRCHLFDYNRRDSRS